MWSIYLSLVSCGESELIDKMKPGTEAVLKYTERQLCCFVMPLGFLIIALNSSDP